MLEMAEQQFHVAMAQPQRVGDLAFLDPRLHQRQDLTGERA